MREQKSLMMAAVFVYKREAIRVNVVVRCLNFSLLQSSFILIYILKIGIQFQKYDGDSSPDYRKFSIDPQITSFEVLVSLLAKAFDMKGYLLFW